MLPSMVVLLGLKNLARRGRIELSHLRIRIPKPYPLAGVLNLEAGNGLEPLTSGV